MKKKAFFLALSFGSLIFGGFYLLKTKGATNSSPTVIARSLKSYHNEFRREDGSAYRDEELAEILLAKGIPFSTEPQNEPAQTAANVELFFINREFSVSQQQEINRKFNEILSVFSQSFPAMPVLQSFQKGLVTGEKKLQLFFSADFKAVVEDESRLTDFNESLNEMGLLGLKGVEIFIEEKPLGELLRELDTRRNAEAATGSQRGGSIK